MKDCSEKVYLIKIGPKTIVLTAFDVEEIYRRWCKTKIAEINGNWGSERKIIEDCHFCFVGYRCGGCPLAKYDGRGSCLRILEKVSPSITLQMTISSFSISWYDYANEAAYKHLEKVRTAIRELRKHGTITL